MKNGLFKHHKIFDQLQNTMPDYVGIKHIDSSLEECIPHPDEYPFVANACRSRQIEFCAGRHAARLALQGHTKDRSVSIPVGASRQPIWPSNIVGSITHDGQHCVAAVSGANICRGIGIDLEKNVSIEPDILALIAHAYEMEIYNNCSFNWGKIVFSAKESVYKLLYPLYGVFLDYKDVVIYIDVATNNFEAKVLSNAVTVPHPLVGKIIFNNQYIFTAITLSN